MPRYLPHAAQASIVIGILAFVLSAVTTMARGQDPSELTLLGRLATVEPASRRITVVPDGKSHLVDVIVAADGEVRQAERELTLSELVIQVGRRVTVRYRVENDRRIAERVIVDPD